MRGVCFLGCLLGIVTTAMISMHVMTTSVEDLSHTRAAEADRAIIQYATRIEEVYQSVFEVDDGQPEDDDDGEDADDEMNEAVGEGAGSSTAAAATAAAPTSSSNWLDALLHEDSPGAAAAGDSSTPPPTSTIVVVAPPQGEGQEATPSPTPPAAASLVPQRGNRLPLFLRRQIPCSGTGAQYCARPLEPAALPPPLPVRGSVGDYRPVPTAWLSELEERDLPSSLRAASLASLDRRPRAPRATAACPPQLPGCRGSFPRDGPNGWPLEPSLGLSGGGGGGGGGGDLAALLALDPCAHRFLHADAVGMLGTLDSQVKKIFAHAAAAASGGGGSGGGGGGGGAGAEAAPQPVTVAFTVLGDRDADLADELAAMAVRVGFTRAGAPDAAAAGGASGGGGVGGAGGAAATQFFVVATGPAAAVACCRAGLTTVRAPPPPPTSDASGEAAEGSLAEARYGAARVLAGLPRAVGSFWLLLPDVSLARHPNEALLRSLPVDAAHARRWLGGGGSGGQGDGGGGGSGGAAAYVLATSAPGGDCGDGDSSGGGSSGGVECVDLATSLRLLPDQSTSDGGVNNPAPDSGLTWARSSKRTEALFRALEAAAKRRRAAATAARVGEKVPLLVRARLFSFLSFGHFPTYVFTSLWSFHAMRAPPFLCLCYCCCLFCLLACLSCCWLATELRWAAAARGAW